MRATRPNWPNAVCPQLDDTPTSLPNHHTLCTCRHISSSDSAFGMKTFIPTSTPFQPRKRESTETWAENLINYTRWIFWPTPTSRVDGRRRCKQLSKRSETCLPDE